MLKPSFDICCCKGHVAVQHRLLGHGLCHIDVGFTQEQMYVLQVLSRQQLHQAVQQLQPSSQQHPSYSDWQGVAHFVVQQWPLSAKPEYPESRSGLQVYQTLLQMGYQAFQLYDCGDGLH